MNGSGRSISRLAIEPSNSGVKVRVYGDCGSRECDWGVQQAIVYEGDPKAQGEPKNAVHVKFDNDVNVSHLIIMRNPRNKGLVVQVFSRDRNGRDRGPDEIKPVNGDTYSIERFERTGGAMPLADHGPRPEHGPRPGHDPRPGYDPRADRQPDPRDTHAYASGDRRRDERRYDDRDDRYAGGDKSYAGGDNRYAGGDARPYEGDRDGYGPEGRGGPSDRLRDDDIGRPDRFRYAGGDWRRPDDPKDCVRFDPDRVELSRSEGSWKIIDGRRWLFDFGGARDEAEQALHVLRHYRADQSCSIGRASGRLTYLLRGGEPLMGAFVSEDCDRFDPDRVRIRRVEGSYWIVYGGRTLYNFGPRDDEAERALEIIQQYGFGASCFAGRSGGGFHYLRR